MVVSTKVHLHEAYCRRNRVKCEICSLFYDKNEKEEHMEEHEKEKCEYCKLEFEIFALEEHKS